MTGIMIDDFSFLLKKNDAILVEVLSDLKKIQTNSINLTANLNTEDLKFITEKFKLEISQLNNSIKKLNGYQNTLRSVYSAYTKQLEQIVIDSRKLMS